MSRVKKLGLQSIKRYGQEIVGVIVRVLLFYALFMLVLIYSFPQGTGLAELYRDLLFDTVKESRLDFGDATAEDLDPIAVISRVSRNVADRPAGNVAWTASSEGKGVRDHHAIQTRRRSAADITFSDDDTLELGEKSLVVIRGPKSRRARGARPSLLVLGGQVRGRVGPQGADAEALKIDTGSVTASVQSTSAQPAEFRVSHNPDESSTVSVYSGEAEVTAGGRTEVIGPMEAVTVEPGAALGAPVRIPDPPRNLAPSAGSVVTYGTTPSQVRFSWAGVAEVDNYRIVVALDPDFEEIIHEKTVASESTSHGRLRPGVYYWRVYSLRGWVISLPSETRVLAIEQDLDAPRLQVDLPTGTIGTDTLTIRGSSEPGARITFGEQRIPIDASGRFEYTIRLERGPNLIALTAVDPVGNAAFYSQYVAADFDRPLDSFRGTEDDREED